MPDINLTEQEVQRLLRCLNERVEPPEELAKKLFPKLYAGFDFKTLNRASIPTIEYAGKRSEAAAELRHYGLRRRREGAGCGEHPPFSALLECGMREERRRTCGYRNPFPG